MEQSTTVIDIDFGMSQLSGNEKLLFTLLGKFTDEYQSTDTELQALVEKGEFDEAYSLVHTLKGVTGNLGLFALHNASKPVESSIRNDKRIPDDFDQFANCLHETITAVKVLTAAPSEQASTGSNTENESAAAQQAKKQLLAALKASEFISQDRLDTWLDTIGFDNAKRTAIVDAVDELDYEQAIEKLESN
ncbi:Hpt domain-containing protein [Alteromonas sp. McT4-15]|jgi:HPt (histidine-containing phosphotransfer) domain-containing protein|uniref:Hpt domain-containing protein n=1 Tax=Alteromonas sp. McT4-15 TaxID=2881256 RepID=UPI001CF8365F|nr:Hpt domain-containing protein [Alteromonas sp. McT4-15]MCB4437402.1 Hpt domain-containing protein [Alteromonas sp. McT4-15]